MAVRNGIHYDQIGSCHHVWDRRWDNERLLVINWLIYFHLVGPSWSQFNWLAIRGKSSTFANYRSLSVVYNMFGSDGGVPINSGYSLTVIIRVPKFLPCTSRNLLGAAYRNFVPHTLTLRWLLRWLNLRTVLTLRDNHWWTNGLHCRYPRMRLPPREAPGWKPRCRQRKSVRRLTMHSTWKGSKGGGGNLLQKYYY